MAGRYDLVVIGMGTGGIVAARLAASVGLRVAAVERGAVGGECLWTGCVPSKALLASARAAAQMRTAQRLGLPSYDPPIDHRLVWRRIGRVQQEIATTDDSPEAFEALGVELVSGTARLTGHHTVEVGERTLDARYVLVATGSRPAIPPIPGLAETGYLTHETLFAADEPPESVVILGGGLIGVELAQGLSRLGVRVTLVERQARLLAGEEPDLVDRLTTILTREGVDVRLGATVESVTSAGRRKIVHMPDPVEAREILVATGRRPTIEGLGLEELGVRVHPDGIAVDRRMRTSVRWLYGAGDVTGPPRFTHGAAYEGAIAFRNMFYPGRSTLPDLIPWCVFTDPELAHAGLTTAEAVERYGADRIQVRRADLSANDRARTDGATDGAIVLVTARRKLVGAHVLAPSAGEVIHELAAAIARGTTLLGLAGLVHVYPTISTSINELAAEAVEELARRYRWTMRLSR